MKLDYGTMGHKGLSYSRQSTLHSCPRKFQLDNALGLASRNDSVTFSFGHGVAAGVQKYLELRTLGRKDPDKWPDLRCKQLALVDAGRHYTFDWFNPGTVRESKAKKNVWTNFFAVDRFIAMYESLLPNALQSLKDYDIAFFEYEGEMIPAVELQFRILGDDGYVYEGHIDAIVQHRITGEYMILELKTTGFRDPHDAVYKNSNQALSYSVVLDKIVKQQDKDAVASYKIMYLIYSSSLQDWIIKIFPKTVKRRLDWINNLIRDWEMIEYYQTSAEESGIPYPTYGGSCFEFFSPCEYFNQCHMEDESLIKYRKTDDHDTQFEHEDNVHFEFDINELLDAQLELAKDRAGLQLHDDFEADALEQLPDMEL